MAIAWTEAFSSFSAAGTGWQDYDLYTNKSVPKGAIAYIVLVNSEADVTNNMGVRTDGSSLERRIQIHEPEAGGVTAYGMYVKCHATTGLIETYTTDTSNTSFYLFGWWTGTDFTETFTEHGPTQGSNVWHEVDVSATVPANRVAQFLLGNALESSPNYLGVRCVGSALNDHYWPIHESEPASAGTGEINGFTVCTKTDGDAAVEMMATNYAGAEVYVVGYFDATMDYVEAETQVAATNSWSDADLTSILDQDGRVVEIVVGHSRVSAEYYCGARENGGASGNRYLLVHECEDTADGWSLYTSIVKTDANGIIETYCGSGSYDQFYTAGYYKDGTSAPVEVGIEDSLLFIDASGGPTDYDSSLDGTLYWEGDNDDIVDEMDWIDAVESCPSGQVVHLLAGTYSIASIIYPAAGSKIIGSLDDNGRPATIFTKVLGAHYFNNAIYLASGVTIRNVATANGLGIYSYDCVNNVTLQDVWLQPFEDAAAPIGGGCIHDYFPTGTGMSGWTMRRLIVGKYVSDGSVGGFNTHGFFLYNATGSPVTYSDFTFDSCEFHRCGYTGHVAYACGIDFSEPQSDHWDNLVVRNCTANECWNDGFHFEDGLTCDGVFENCTARLNGYGWGKEGDPGDLIGTGIHLGHDDNYATVSILNCDLSDNYGGGYWHHVGPSTNDGSGIQTAGGAHSDMASPPDWQWENVRWVGAYSTDAVTVLDRYRHWAPTDGTLASTDANWEEGLAPTEGCEVIFNSGSGNCTWDVEGVMGGVEVTSGYSGKITLGADLECNGFSMAGGELTGFASYALISYGDVVQSGGVITANLLRIVMAGDGASLNLATNNNIYSLAFEADTYVNYNVRTTANSGGGVTVAEGVTITIASGRYLDYRACTGCSFSNSGTIAGEGTLYITLFNEDHTLTFGDVDCPVRVFLHSGAGASYKLVLGTNAALASTLLVESDSPTYTCTLDGDGHDLDAAGDFTVGTRGVFLGSVVCGGDLDASAGSLGASATSVTMAGAGKTLTAPAGTVYINALTVNDDTTLSATNLVADDVTVASGKTLTNSATNIWHRTYIGSLTNGGAIGGAGAFCFELYDTDSVVDIAPGVINCPVYIEAWGGGSADLSANLTSDASLGSSLTIRGDAGSAVTLDAAGHDLDADGDFTVGTRGVFLGGEGSHSFSGNWDSSAGTFTRETCLVTLTGSGRTLKMNATDACAGGFYDLTIAAGASYTLLSDLWYWGTLTKTGSLNDSTFDEVYCGAPLTGWRKIVFASEPPVSSAWNKVAYLTASPSGWSKVKLDGD